MEEKYKKQLIDELIKEVVKVNPKQWFNELGLEGTIELIERAVESNYPANWLYVEELKKKGLWK